MIHGDRSWDKIAINQTIEAQRVLNKQKEESGENGKEKKKQ